MRRNRQEGREESPVEGTHPRKMATHPEVTPENCAGIVKAVGMMAPLSSGGTLAY